MAKSKMQIAIERTTRADDARVALRLKGGGDVRWQMHPGCGACRGVGRRPLPISDEWKAQEVEAVLAGKPAVLPPGPVIEDWRSDWRYTPEWVLLDEAELAKEQERRSW